MTQQNQSKSNYTQSLGVLGNTPRKSRFDPDLARQVNEEVEREERLEELRRKREGKKKPTQTETPEQETHQTPLTIPDVNAQYSFLGGDLGKQVNERIHQRYSAIEAITKITYNPNSQLVEGSNPFYVIAVNEVLRELYPDLKIRTANQADLERILKLGNPDLRNQYEDSALVLRTEEEPNEYLAKDLMKQVKARNPKLKTPVMISLNGLNLRQDSNSPYKLSFELTDYSELIYAPQLSHSNDQKEFTNTDENGLPVFDKGTRTLYTRESGLSRLYLGGYLGLSSRSEYLVDSYSDGRVVVVVESAEGAAPLKNKA